MTHFGSQYYFPLASCSRCNISVLSFFCLFFIDAISLSQRQLTAQVKQQYNTTVAQLWCIQEELTGEVECAGEVQRGQNSSGSTCSNYGLLHKKNFRMNQVTMLFWFEFGAFANVAWIQNPARQVTPPWDVLKHAKMWTRLTGFTLPGRHGEHLGRFIPHVTMIK